VCEATNALCQQAYDSVVVYGACDVVSNSFITEGIKQSRCPHVHESLCESRE